MQKKLKLLLIEDSLDDAELLIRQIEKSGYELEYSRVETEKQLMNSLECEDWDFVISDYSLPNFTGLSAINIIKQLGIDIPIIIVSGAIGEDIAVEAMKAGAHDYIMKDNLARLSPAIERELREVQVREERRQAVNSLRESEQKYHNLFDQSPVGVFIVNKDLVITESNKRAADIFLTNLERLIGSDIRELVDKSLISLINQAFKGKSSQKDIHYRSEFDQDDTWLYCCVSPLKDSGKKVTDVMGVLEDITQRKHAEQGIQKLNINLEKRVELRTHELTSTNLKLISEINHRKEAEKKLKSSLREKEVLLKEVHHRVKNNLQLISSMIGLQRDGLEDSNSLYMLEESERRIQSIALIHEHPYSSEDFEHINFSDYISLLVENLYSSFQIYPGHIETKMELEEFNLDIDKAVPCSLIINELISNSLKHAFPLKPLKSSKSNNIIDIKARMLKNTDIQITISDNGVGFPKDIDYKNTNTLGMQLVCSLVDQLHGTIKLSSKSGTKFSINFH